MGSLIEWAGLNTERRDQLVCIFKLLTEEALCRPAAPPFPGLSFINSDGLPLQWVLRFSAEGDGFGFVCETGTPGQLPQQRCAQTIERLMLACASAGVKRPDSFSDILALLLPHAETPWPAHWRSAIWTGVNTSNTGIQLKPYLNLNRDSPRERWLRAGWLLKSLGRLRSLEQLCELSGVVSADSWPVGLAIDLRASGEAGRVKVYFRSGTVEAAWLERWYRATGYAAHFGVVRRCLDLFPWVGKRPYPPAAFTISLEFHPDDGPATLKTDCGVTKWIASDAQVLDGAASLIALLGGDPQRLREALRAIDAQVGDDSTDVLRFVGLGSERDGSCHVNVYVEPPLGAGRSPSNPPRPRAVAEAIDAGLAFLGAKARDGYWRDYCLPTGESTSWVTAYVLARLGGIAENHLSDALNKQIAQALDWLLEAHQPGGGWGYNATVPDDADSTSWAILALQRWGRPVPDGAFDLLRRCERPDGGIATYPKDTSPGPAWSLSAPDVTAVAFQALARPPSEANLHLFTRWMRPDGTLPAYWWASSFYTLAAVLDWLGDAAAWEVAGDHVGNAFEQALLLGCLSKLRCVRARPVAARLLEMQKPDGSWSPSALLRLPPADVIQPWEIIDAGPLYLDQKGVFTTATVIAALAAWHRLI